MVKKVVEVINKALIKMLVVVETILVKQLVQIHRAVETIASKTTTWQIQRAVVVIAALLQMKAKKKRILNQIMVKQLKMIREAKAV